MEKTIQDVLQKEPGLKGTKIARKAGIDRRSANSCLHKHKKLFRQDENYCWFLATPSEKILELENYWVTGDSFEQSLRDVGCLFDSNTRSVLVKIPEECKIMLIAAARLLALLNQLVSIGKDVTIDLEECASTKFFLSRDGFFDHLDEKVKVVPNRPEVSAAKIYKGNSDTLVEFGAIDLERRNKDLVIQLTERFVQQSDSRFQTAAFTVFSELIGNVSEHSESPIHGFAALQKYGGRRKHIQTVISDSGLGIAETLRPSLKQHYPKLYKLYSKKNTKSDARLVQTALSKGEISRWGSGHGLGFKSSRAQAMKFDANLSIRQDQFYLNFKYECGLLIGVESELNVPIIKGTHICFDFFVDPS